MNIIDLPPYAPTLIESTRAIGYSLEAAVADIVDNSIAADASSVKISFFPLDGAYISILDNGVGMSGKELTAAMQYGSKNPLELRNANDLGRFGLGLKTASLSQCRVLTVATKKNNELSIRRWDIDFVTKQGSWSLLDLNSSDEIENIPNIDELNSEKSGTLVVWQKLDRMEAGEIDFSKSMGIMLDSVREHLSLVYHRYLAGEPGINRLSIEINGANIEPADPFLAKYSDRPMDDEIFIIDGSKITVRPYILPHLSSLTPEEIRKTGGKDGLRKLQGFYVYRNKRLLVWGTWFRMMRKGDLSKLARIQVDIPNTLDSLWTLDIKKSSAMPPAEVRHNLEHVIERIAEKSRRKYTVRGKKEISDNTVHIWNRMKAREGGYYYEINRDYPTVKQVASQSEIIKKMMETLFRQIETGLPLNQLYVDLNNDESICNDQEISDEEIRKALKSMLLSLTDKESKLTFLEGVSQVEPFSKHESILVAIRDEVIKNEE